MKTFKISSYWELSDVHIALTLDYCDSWSCVGYQDPAFLLSSALFSLTHTHRHTTIQVWAVVSEIPNSHQKDIPPRFSKLNPLSHSFSPPICCHHTTHTIPKSPYTSFIACHFCCQRQRCKFYSAICQLLSFLLLLWTVVRGTYKEAIPVNLITASIILLHWVLRAEIVREVTSSYLIDVNRHSGGTCYVSL
jgi:hypothetical protein